MTSEKDLQLLAAESPFIFTGLIRRSGASTMAMLPVDGNTAVVTVEDVIRCPPGLTSFAGIQVTVQLLESLATGRYVFFADPWAVGGGIAVRERAHLKADAQSVRNQVTFAIENGYTATVMSRWSAATVVVLGTTGSVESIGPISERPRGVPWALVSLEIEQVFKGDLKVRQLTLVGPRYASRRLPLAPPLKSKLNAIFFLQTPPKEAIAVVPENHRDGLLFIATSSDIQPPERRSTIAQINATARK
jgi:hypothetical protein